jgi:Protein of unknown function (DUF4239)
MSAIEIALMIFVITFTAGAVGMALHMIVPEHHLDPASRDVVKLVMGLIATMAALVLSLLIASGNSSYQTQETEVQSLSANIILLDRLLSFYGPEAKEPRELLRQGVVTIRDRIWSSGGSRSVGFNPGATRDVTNAFIESVERLSPKTDSQTALKTQSLQVSQNLGQIRLLMFEQAASSLSWPFLTVLVFWIVMLFVGFGVFARFNATILITITIGALSVASAIFLILELNQPYKGLMAISDAPVRDALVLMGPEH